MTSASQIRVTSLSIVFSPSEPSLYTYSLLSFQILNHRVHCAQSTPGRLYIGRRNESARADRRVMRKKTGASTILKEIEENRDFELFSLSGHFSQSFWC